MVCTDFQNNQVELCFLEQRGKRAIPSRWKTIGSTQGMVGPTKAVLSKYLRYDIDIVTRQSVQDMLQVDPMLLDAAHLLAKSLIVWNPDLLKLASALKFIWGECPDRNKYSPTIYNLYESLKHVGAYSLLIYHTGSRHLVETRDGLLKDTVQMKFMCFGDLRLM